MLVWNLDMYDKEKRKKKKKVYKSKQASINALSNFLLLMFFLCFTSNCVGECFSFLAQLHNNSIYSKSYRWAPYKLYFINNEIKLGSFPRCVLKPKLDSSCCKYWWFTFANLFSPVFWGVVVCVAWGLKHKAHALDNRVNLNSVGGSTSKRIVKA